MLARWLGLGLLSATMLVGCGGTVTESGPDNGGAAGTGGVAGSGGVAGTGGVAGSGGAAGTGGIAGSGGVKDGGVGVNECRPGYCQNAGLASCGDPDFVPLGNMTCTLASAQPGYCCLPACGGLAGAICEPDQYCDYAEIGPACGGFDGAGVCKVKPEGCDADCPGVCGCDGQFYCNACKAHQAGTDVSDLSSCTVDSGTGFTSQLEGVWLIGWSGGMNHYSWVRFGMNDPFSGIAEFLAGDALPVNAPYWPCSGLGTWMITAKPDTVQLLFPDSCGLTSEALTFVSFGPATGYPPDSILTANIEAPGTSSYLEGYKFPSTQCSMDMSICADPFGY